MNVCVQLHIKFAQFGPFDAFEAVHRVTFQCAQQLSGMSTAAPKSMQQIRNQILAILCNYACDCGVCACVCAFVCVVGARCCCE